MRHETLDEAEKPEKPSTDSSSHAVDRERHESHVHEQPPESALQRTLSTLSRASSWKEPGPPPDGGLQAWTQVLMGHLVIFNAWGFVSSFGTFQTYYLTTLDQSASSISWIGTFQIWLMFCIGTLSGRALDAGLFHYVFLPGVFLQLLGIMLTSLCTRYWHVFLAQGICIGIGNGLIFTPAIGVVSTYFTSKRTVALACCAAGGGTGGLVFPAIFQQLLPRLGFPWTVRVSGFVMLFNHLFTCTLLRPRLPPRKAGPLVEWRAFREPTYACFVAGMFFAFWGLYYGFFYVGTFARDVVGLSTPQSIDLLLLVNGLSSPGRVAPALLADWRLGPLNTITPYVLFCAVMFYTWMGVRDGPGAYAWAAFYGLANAGVQGLWPATLASLTKDPRFVGVRIGMGFTICSFGALTGSPLGGALVAAGGGGAAGWRGSMVWAGTSMLVGFVLLVVARVHATGWVLRARV